MFGTTKLFLDYFGLKKLEDLPPLADLSDWETLRVQLDLPAVEEDEIPVETAEIMELPPIVVEDEEEADDYDDFDINEIPALTADTGFQKIVASEWPDPTADEIDDPEQTDAGDTDDVDETRSGT